MTYPLWILCQVIDNFGDAGVCWRLARGLAATGRFEVTLAIDLPATLAAIEPRLLRPEAGRGGSGDAVDHRLHGVHIIKRSRIEQQPATTLPAVIVSAFGCEPPQWLRTRLAGGPRQPLWLQLEYLSAEDWIEDCHGLVSIKPVDSAREHFLYPGFTPRSAGLLREADLFERRDTFRLSGGPAALLAQLNASPAPGQRVFSLFCYPSAPLEPWFDELARSPTRTLVCVAGGSADDALLQSLGRRLAIGDRRPYGQIEVVRLPMLDQDTYDQLLWSCALNVVRGEDSWLRAHWAGVPFVWQAYPQAEGAHLSKLEAFLAKMRQGVASHDPDQSAIEGLMRSWNGAHVDGRPDRRASARDPHQDDPSASTALPEHPIRSAWRNFDERWATGRGVESCYRRWVDALARQTSLVERLTRYCLDRLE